MRRRLGLLAATGWPWLVNGQPAAPSAADASQESADPVRRGRPMQFPRDHGAHLGSRIEWWYATGWLRAEGRPELLGFQVTFFRSRTGLPSAGRGRLQPRHLLFAHAALTDIGSRRHLHADRIARWSGENTPGLRARAATQDADVELGGWHFRRHDAGQGSRYDTRVQTDAFAFELQLHGSQPLLLQGDGGFSRKGPQETQASHYVTEPQLRVQGRVRLAGQTLQVQGQAWIDHEWSDELLHPEAVGWDWIGINRIDGGALTAFQLRRADGSALWAGGSLRPAQGPARHFGPQDIRFIPGRRWHSASSGADYPVQWQLQTPDERLSVSALMDGQELDGRSSTGTVYWEGLSQLQDGGGQRIGLGYLEMTGYRGRLQL